MGDPSGQYHPSQKRLGKTLARKSVLCGTYRHAGREDFSQSFDGVDLVIPALGGGLPVAIRVVCEDIERSFALLLRCGRMLRPRIEISNRTSTSNEHARNSPNHSP
jgi:hypothetical protein